jgi:hypothetical protein
VTRGFIAASRLVAQSSQTNRSSHVFASPIVGSAVIGTFLQSEHNTMMYQISFFGDLGGNEIII